MNTNLLLPLPAAHSPLDGPRYALRAAPAPASAYHLVLEDAQGVVAHWTLPLPAAEPVPRQAAWLHQAADAAALAALPCLEAGAVRCAGPAAPALRAEVAEGQLLLGFGGGLLRGCFRLRRAAAGSAWWQLTSLGLLVCLFFV